MIPDTDLARVRRWIDERNSALPENAREQIGFEIHVTDRSITVLECRPPWRDEVGPEWTRFPVARLRYAKTRNEWSLHWRDRNLRFHEYDLVRPTRHVDRLLAEIDRDPTAIFWG